MGFPKGGTPFGRTGPVSATGGNLYSWATSKQIFLAQLLKMLPGLVQAGVQGQGGAQGVRVYMSSLEEDLVRAMTMTGVASLNQVPSKIVTKLVR